MLRGGSYGYTNIPSPCLPASESLQRVSFPVARPRTRESPVSDGPPSSHDLWGNFIPARVIHVPSRAPSPPSLFLSFYAAVPRETPRRTIRRGGSRFLRPLCRYKLLPKIMVSTGRDTRGAGNDRFSSR